MTSVLRRDVTDMTLSVSDIMNCAVGFVDCILRVPLVHLPCCPVPYCQDCQDSQKIIFRTSMYKDRQIHGAHVQ